MVTVALQLARLPDGMMFMRRSNNNMSHVLVAMVTEAVTSIEDR